MPLEAHCKEIWNVAARPLVCIICLHSRDKKNRPWLVFLFSSFCFIAAQMSSQLNKIKLQSFGWEGEKKASLQILVGRCITLPKSDVHQQPEKSPRVSLHSLEKQIPSVLSRTLVNGLCWACPCPFTPRRCASAPCKHHI